MQSNNEYKVAIVGFGKVGASIAESLYLNQRLLSIHLRNKAALHIALNRFYNSSLLKIGIEFTDNLPNVIILAVPDNQIEIAANELAMSLGKQLNGILVFHCSGIHSYDKLSVLADLGALTAACHPFQTFHRSSEKLLHDIAWGVSAKSGEYWYFADFLSQISGRPFQLSDNLDKAKYHSSAVFASNFLTTLFQISRKILNEYDLPEDVFLKPIMQQALNNNLDSIKLNSFPLTGPIARGSIESIKSHINSLADNPIYKRAYIHFSLATLELAFSRNAIEEDVFYEIFELLKQKLNES